MSVDGEDTAAARPRVVITGVGVVNAEFSGDSRALGAWLAAPPAPASTAAGPVRLAEGVVAALVDEVEARRLSRACRLSLAAARLALGEAGHEGSTGLGLVLGTEMGDFTSTIDFAEGYLERGPAGLSALLFPNTVMNTMAATTAIGVVARAPALTLNVPTVAGEVAVARAAAAVAAGRAAAVLAGGVDEIDPRVAVVLGEMGDTERRGEGAVFLVLETEASARARGATPLGEILAVALGALPARPWGVGRRVRSTVVTEALERARLAASDVGWVYGSATGDVARDVWEDRVLAAGLAGRPPLGARGRRLGQHAGLGPLRVAAACWTARTGLLPSVEGGPRRVSGERGLVHGLGRSGTHVAIVAGAA